MLEWGVRPPDPISTDAEGLLNLPMRNFWVLTTLLPLLGAVSVARAATWGVPVPVPTVSAALDSAAAFDTVLVAPGLYAEFGLTLPESVTLLGATGDPLDVVLDGTQLGRILDVSGNASGRVEAMTFRNGLADTGEGFERAGGALRCDNSTLDVANCRFESSTATFGGAIGARASTVNVDSSTFSGNNAAGLSWAAGGGMYAQDCTGLVTDCVFLNNGAAADTIPADGGGMFADSCTLLVQDCLFTGNSAQAGAGGFYSFGDQSNLIGCTFEFNVAGAGGAMYLETALGSISDCTFRDNTATNGGALFIAKFSDSLIEDTVFEHNQTGLFSGGAIDCWLSDAEIIRCYFRANEAGWSGGAVSLHQDANVTLNECFLLENEATFQGGAVRGEANSTVSISRCTLAANGSASGGGVYLIDTATASIDESVIVFSTSGEAAGCTGSAEITLTCTDVFGNAGGDWVGCIAAQAGLAGNLSADPEFCDLAGGSAAVTLPGSPCLPQNNPCGVLIGAGAAGCGCPEFADRFVPGDHATISDALAAAAFGETIGVCSGTYVESIELVSGVHLRGVRSDFVSVTPAGGSDALIRAAAIKDSTVVSGLTLDGQGTVTQVVLAEMGTTALHLASNVITGGATYGILNEVDCRITIGASLADANDIFGNGGATPVNVRNENALWDSLDATLNYWGTEQCGEILPTLQGAVRGLPITNAAHEQSLCGPATTVGLNSTEARTGPRLTIGPNPFDVAARISFVLPAAEKYLRIEVYDVQGRLVARLWRGPHPAGAGRVGWDGRDHGGSSVASGVYFVRLTASSGRLGQRVVRLRP